jgi:membrane-bound serine protease (ClpP class)
VQHAIAALVCGLLLALPRQVGGVESAPAAPGRPGGPAVLLELRDAIGPATSDYFISNLHQAESAHATLLILQLDTPGGLESSMRDMTQAILASGIPVVVYVAPAGARAASAGTYLLYASHIAAMAPATNVGAATPVQILGTTPASAPGDGDAGNKGDNGTGSGSGKRSSSKGEGGKGDGGKSGGGSRAASGGDALQHKAINDAAASIRGLAQLRGRNAEWAELAVRDAASLSADEALKLKVIDLIASDSSELLARIDGRGVTTSLGHVTLATRGLQVVKVEAGWRTKLLSALTNPNFAYLLLLVGIYGLLLEGYHPGAILPGVAGAISLLLALYAFQLLAVNYAGLALMVLGMALIGAEVFVPSGVLAVGGIIAFVIGSIMLFERGVPGYHIARPLIGTVAFFAALFAVLLLTYLLRARRRPVVTGASTMLSATATALDAFGDTGEVRVGGELWRAHTRAPIVAGQQLRIVSVNGLLLEVEPLADRR